MKVKLVRQHPSKAADFLKKHGGAVFDVICAREGGYDVDLAPMGHPGKWGFMYSEEVEVVDERPTILERLADEQHESWSRWMDYLFSLSTLNPDGSCAIPADRVRRWQRQIETRYAELSEPAKELDRKEVRRFLRIIRK